MVALNELHLSSVNLTAAKRMAQTALAAVQQGQLGYAVIGAVQRMKDRATAYVCENYICKLPTTDEAVMARLLDNKN